MALAGYAVAQATKGFLKGKGGRCKFNKAQHNMEHIVCFMLYLYCMIVFLLYML